MKEKLAIWPQYEQDEIEAVTRVLTSGKVNYWTGQEGREFEKEYAAYTGTKYAIAMMNGTVTMESALYALGIGPGDDVIVPSHTFMATASAVVARGATPIVADIDLNSNNLTAETIAAVYTTKTKAIIAVHLAGFPCEMDSILAFAKKHDLKVIEDCAQAHGAFYKGKPVGSMGDVGSFSFCQDKIITTAGEGGMVVTNDEGLWKKMWAYKDHGKNYDAVYHREHAPGFRWLIESFGTNFRMTEMQAAIGRLQLRKLPEWTQKRTQNANILTEALQKTTALRVMQIPDYMVHAHYKYHVYVRPEFLNAGWSRDRIMHEINKAGVPCFVGGCSEIYREKAFTNSPFAVKTRLVNAKAQGENTLQFLIHPTLTVEQMNSQAEVILDVMQQAQI